MAFSILLSRSAVNSASDEAVIVINRSNDYSSPVPAFVVEREPDGGIVSSEVNPGAFLFPVSMAKTSSLLEGGDWLVVPYVRDSSGNNVETDDCYTNIDVVWC